MGDTERVRRALRSLADGEADRGYRRELREAARALEDVTDAAAFVAADGRERLRRAVRRAERAGDRTAARDGRRTLRAFRRIARAAAGTDAGGESESADGCRTPDPYGRGPPPTDGAAPDGGPDHFRPGRGTVLGGGRQRSRR
jgi:hypothetical protein